MALKALTSTVREEKERKGIQIVEQKIKIPLFTDDMIVYIEYIS